MLKSISQEAMELEEHYVDYPISVCGTNSYNTQHTLFCQVSKLMRAEFSLIHTKFLKTCSLLYISKKTNACSKMLVKWQQVYMQIHACQGIIWIIEITGVVWSQSVQLFTLDSHPMCAINQHVCLQDAYPPQGCTMDNDNTTEFIPFVTISWECDKRWYSHATSTILIDVGWHW